MRVKILCFVFVCFLPRNAKACMVANRHWCVVPCKQVSGMWDKIRQSGMESWNIWRSGQTLLLPTRLLPLRKVSPFLGTADLCYAKHSHAHTCVIHFHGDIVYQVITSFRDCNFISVTPEHAINELSLVDANRIIIFITSSVWSDEVMNMNCISCNSRTEWAVHNKA